MIEINTYNPLCQYFDNMAQKCYFQYSESSKELNELPQAIDVLSEPTLFEKQMALEQRKIYSAIGAVTFEAIAIEAYVNFFGAYYIEDFYIRYENSRHRLSTLEKIKQICKSEYGHAYPTDGQHFRYLKGLFLKRDRLVHSKPYAHNISGEGFDGYEAAMEEIDFLYKNIENELKLYDEVKKKLSECTGEKDANESLKVESKTNLAKVFAEMLNKAFKIEAKDERVE